MEQCDINSILNTIICGDALEEMRKIPAVSVDLAAASPSYNLKNSTGNGMKDGRGGKWKYAALVQGFAAYDDNMPYGLCHGMAEGMSCGNASHFEGSGNASQPSIQKSLWVTHS